MPRRRMIDPDFWSDGRVKHLTPTERLFFLGLISHADDEGRIQGNPTFLRSVIFPYDNFTLKQITKMRSHVLETNPNIKLYENSGEEYLYFEKWARYQKPSHPQPSKLPKPPERSELQELGRESIRESHQPQTGTIPSQVSLGQVRLGQSSLGKVSIGKDSAVLEDFTKYLDSEKDLTDRLTKELDLCVGRPAFGMQVVKQLWEQGGLGKPDDVCFQLIHEALSQRSPANMALCLTKAVKNLPGKKIPAKYLQSIFADHPDNSSKGAK